MKRYFFNLASKDTNIPDTKGREFSDLAGAHRHAMLAHSQDDVVR